MDYLWSFVPPSIRNISTHIDYIGQKHAEHLFQVLSRLIYIFYCIVQIVLIVHGIVGFIVGYITQQLSYSIYILGFGFVLSCLLVLPPWPQFRAHPLKVCICYYCCACSLHLFSGKQWLQMPSLITNRKSRKPRRINDMVVVFYRWMTAFLL